MFLHTNSNLKSMRVALCVFAVLLGLLSAPALLAANTIADLGGKAVTHMVYDSVRNVICATSTAGDSLLFIDATTMTALPSLYVGKAPRDLDIDITGSKLYVSSDGQSPGVPGSALIAEIDLATRTLTRSIPLPITYWSSEVTRAMHIKAGRAGRLYYDGGFMGSGNGGNARLLNLDTGLDITGLDVIKTNMVMSPDRTRLYGQYVYTPNLGEMGMYNVSTDSATKIGTNRYPPYPYGWSGDNPYVISSDGTKLIYDTVLFNAAAITQVYGTFTENIYALNSNGRFAVGATSLWDSSTFSVSGNATKLLTLPFSSSVMLLGPDDSLYVFNATDTKLYKLNLFSTAPVPPTAQNDSYSCAGTSLTMAAAKGLLANDTDLNFDTITAELLDAPLHGSVIINTNGSFTYTPTAGYSGMDSFTYKAKDATSFSVGTAAISVLPLTVSSVSPASGLGGTQLSNVVLNGSGFVMSSLPTAAGAVSFNGHNYLYVSTAMTWSAANTYCKGLSGHLATITSAAENAFVLSLNTSATKWIGLTDEVTEGTFVWTTGEPLSYTNWQSGEPNNSSNEDYGQMYTSGLWNDASATSTAAFACEFEPIPTQVALKKNGVTINGTNVRLNSSAQLLFDIDLTGAALGAWDVVVTDFDSGTTATLPGGFVISLTTTSTSVAAVAPLSYKTTAQTISLSATVTPQVGSLNSGTVTFQLLNGATNLGTAVTSGTLVNGATGNVNYAIPASTAPGSFTISATYNPTATYQGSVDASKQLSITPAALAVSPNSFSRQYGSPNPSLSGTVTGVQSGDGITASYATAAIDASAPGNYPITATLSDPLNKLSNYNVTLNSGTLTVTKAPLTVTAANAARQPGADNPTLTGTITGIKLADNITATYTTTATPASPEGLYPITPNLIDPGNKLGNYSVSIIPGTLTVGNTPVLTVTANNYTRSYGTPNPALDGTVTGIQNNDNITVVFTTVAVAGSPVGTYAIVPTLFDPGNKLVNYIVVKNNGLLTVTVAPPIVVTPTSITRFFGVSNPPLTGTISGVLNGDAITASYTCSATQSSVPGQYLITSSLNDPSGKLSNYTTNLNNAYLTVTPAPITVTGATITRNYGSIPAVTGTLTGVNNGDNITASFATSATSTSGVGIYPIIPTLIDPGNKLVNYDVTIVNGTYNIAPKPLTVTANSMTRAYASSVATYTGTVSGVVNNDNITAAYSSIATVSSPVGTYPIVPTLLDPDSKLSNYAVTLINGTLNIIKAPAIVVTAADATRAYGAANPQFTGTISGVLNNDNVTVAFTCAATPASPAGTYPVVAGLSDPDNRAGNYALVLKNATLTVTPIPLSVTVADATRFYHQDNPDLTGTVAGTVNDDAITAVYSVNAGFASPVGVYDITAQLVDPDSRLKNYVVSTTIGKLTIQKALPAIAWPAPARIVAGTALGIDQFTATASDPFTNDALAGSFTYDPGDGSILAPGLAQTLNVAFAPDDADNYASANGTTHIDVDPAIPALITSSLSVSVNVSDNFTYTVETTGSAPLVISVSNLPDGLSFDGTVITGTLAASGQFNVILTATNYGGSDTKTLHISAVGTGVNRAPAFSSPIAASANPVDLGVPVSLTASATDADGDILGYTWDFGDGTMAVGAAVTKTYSAAGVYVVSVTVSDGQASLTQSINLVVQEAEPAGNFAVQKVAGSFDFSKPNKDMLSVSGQVPVPASFNPEGKVVRVLIGGIDKTYTLRAKASAASKEFKLNGRSKNGVASFTFALKNSALFAPLAELGFSKSPGTSNLDFPMIVVFDGTNYFDSLTVNYSVKNPKKGSFSGKQK